MKLHRKVVLRRLFVQFLLALFLVVFTAFGSRQAEAQVLAYVGDSSSGLYNVSVIDTITNTVVTTVPTAGSGASWLAITPDGHFVYVVNIGSDTVSVISTLTNTSVAIVPVASPSVLAITPNGRFVYVTSINTNTVSVISTRTNTIVASVAVVSPAGIAITHDGLFTYVVNAPCGGGQPSCIIPGTVSVIDVHSNTVVKTGILVGPGGNLVAITPHGDFAYVSNFGSNTISVIDTTTSTVVNTIIVGPHPLGVAFTPPGPNAGLAYVANQSNEQPTGTVSVIDTKTQSVVATIPAGPFPIGVDFTPRGDFAYVTDDTSAPNVVVIKTATGSVVTTIGVGLGPVGVAITERPI